MKHRGTIAPLPRPIREPIDRRLGNGAEGKQIAEWLNTLPEATAAMAAESGGTECTTTGLESLLDTALPDRNDTHPMKQTQTRSASVCTLMLAIALCAPSLPLLGQEATRRGRGENQTERTQNQQPDESKPDAGKTDTKTDKKEAGDKKEPKDELIETTNSVTINGVAMDYTATTGTIVIKDEEGKAHVSFFFIAYTKQGVTNLSERPVTFSFNGGPGSSSVWLHLGLLGPRRVFLNDNGNMPPLPFHLVNNDYSLLDETDLVFIDPVSTGYTRTVPGENPQNYHGVDQDLESVGNFIRLYTSRYERWSSPKFLIGESYGTTRAAGLSGYLENHYGLYLNGIALVSSVLNFKTLGFNVGNDLPYILYLPTETAAAWFHKKLPADLQADRQKALQESEQFALGDYTRALMKGTDLGDAERQQVIKTLARLTGLSEDFLDRANLRVRAQQFFKELLRSQRLTIGRYDSRVTGRDEDAVGEAPDYDPSYTEVLGVFSACFNDYVRKDLKFKSDLPYEILTSKVQPWDYNQFRNRYVDVAQTLRTALTHNPYLKVFVANGYYDMATPFLATHYTFDHLALAPDRRANVSMGFYDAGHMMYVNKPSLIQLKSDLAKFIHSALPPK
jgi:carboxypeptidase C (cathepsin A)